MIKYILAGGNDLLYDDYGRQLADEVKKTVNNPKILSCFFSQPEESWQERGKQWQNYLKKFFGPIDHEIARVETFFDQAEKSNVIYLHGGDSMGLFEVLDDVEKVKKAFSDKVVIGSSRGAHYLSRMFWRVLTGTAHKGTGLVDKNIIAHFGSSYRDLEKFGPTDWERTLREFKKVLGDGQAVTKLKEGHFIVIED